MKSTRLFIPKSISKSNGKLSIDVIDSWSKGYGAGNKTHNVGIQRPPVGSYAFFYFMAKYETAFRTCNEILKSYHFREGLEWTNQLKYEEEIKKLNNFFNDINLNKQTLIDICKEIESDLNIADDAYICFSKEYILDPKTGDIVNATIHEVFRGNPQFYRFVTADNTRIGRVYGRCLVCEAIKFKNNPSLLYQATTDPVTSRQNHQEVHQYKEELYDFNDKIYRCPNCNCKLHDVEFIVSYDENTDDPAFYHIAGEVYHFSKYNTSRLYGLSPIITIANHMDIRIKLVQYLQTFLEYRRVPEGAIFINTGNPKHVKQSLEQAQKKYMQDRYYQPIIAVNAEKSGGNFIQYIKFTPLPEELKMHEQMSDLKREIAAFLGVQNVMLNDLEGVGGMNSESLQVQVTDRAARAGQLTYNDKIFPRLLYELGRYGQYDIPDDLRLTVKRTDNAENESRLHNLNQQVLLALNIADMGYEITPDFPNMIGTDGSKVLPFSFRKLTNEEIREQQMMGMIDPVIPGDRTDTPGEVPKASRPSMPGVRRKEFLGSFNKEGFPIIAEVVGYDENKMYRVNISQYEYTYVTKEVHDKINEEKLRFINKEKDKLLKRKKERLSYWLNLINDGETQLLISCVKAVHKDNPKLKSIDLLTKSIDLMAFLLV